MSRLTIPDENTRHHRLLGGWRDVLDDIRTTCRTLAELPDVCQCGNGAAHLEGTCPCCGSTADERVPSCRDCDEQLARLRPAMDGLTVDTFRFFPFVKELLSKQNAVASTRVLEIETHIAALVRSFDQLIVADGEFRDECRASHLKTLKDSAAALRRDAENLNRIV